MHRPIITLTTDFGLKDPYVAEMKAVVLSLCPEAVIVDISHQVEKFNVRMGAYILASATPYFPSGAVHVAVIDPGVGTRRRGVIVCAKETCFVGPDNGVLALAAKNANGPKNIYVISRKELALSRVSHTFHGRDVFAPVAAYLASGRAPSEFGPKTTKMSSPAFAEVVSEKSMIIGEVIHVDDFGNVVTNLGSKHLRHIRYGQMIEVRLKTAAVKLRFCRAYGDVSPRRPLALIGSHDFLEISVNQGSARDVFGVEIGSKIRVRVH